MLDDSESYLDDPKFGLSDPVDETQVASGHSLLNGEHSVHLPIHLVEVKTKQMAPDLAGARLACLEKISLDFW